MLRKFIIFLFFILTVSGCATYVKKSPAFDTAIKEIKTIAVMPPDIEVYQLSAGGVRELMDEWSDTAQALFRKSLEKNLADRFGYKVKFIDKEWLKANYKELWNENKALYQAVAISALMHAYPGELSFPDKTKSFDYTLGQELSQLAKVCQADALLFVQGVDHEATAGRTALLVWNLVMAGFTGVSIIPVTPSNMNMGLADAKTGALAWFKITAHDAEYSFRNEQHVNILVEWFTRDFLQKKK